MKIVLTLLSLVACSYGQNVVFHNNDVSLNTPTIPQNDNFRFPEDSMDSTIPPAYNRPPPPPGRSSASSAAVAPNPIFTENWLREWKGHVDNIIANGLFKFALDVETDIYKTRSMTIIRGPEDNIVFSPISLAVTMAIVLAGSAGRTFDEVTKVLGLESGVDISQLSEVVHLLFGASLGQLRRRMEGNLGPRIDFATATYVQDGYPIRPQFKNLSNTVYMNEVINVDFIRNGKGAQDAINRWVNLKTMGKISSILSDVPGPETSVILVSALYFNGAWNQPFLERSTRRKKFFIEPDKTVQVNMMYNGGNFPFYEDKQLGVKILGLPYKGQEISMYILLPTAEGAKALRNFKSQLTVEIIEKLISNMKNETCIIAVPKMKLSSSLELKSTLAALGLRSLFDPAMADLSLISPGNSPIQPRNNVSFDPRINTFNGQRDHIVKRNYFAYEDKLRGLIVNQWNNGFNITRSRNYRHYKVLPLNRNSYSVEGSKVNNNTKIVDLESNKYRYQKERVKGRSKRQSRPFNRDLLEFLKQMNIPSFGLDDLRNSANLVNPHLYASNVLHKVEIDITEKGTEAAATTAVTLERDGSQKKLIADRPFIFFIRHDATRLVLFWGTLNTPTPYTSTPISKRDVLIFN